MKLSGTVQAGRAGLVWISSTLEAILLKREIAITLIIYSSSNRSLTTMFESSEQYTWNDFVLSAAARAPVLASVAKYHL
jgi:hypothetical protein